MRYLGPLMGRGRQNKVAGHWVVCGQVRITHHQCRKAILDEILITPPVVGLLVCGTAMVLCRFHWIVD